MSDEIRFARLNDINYPEWVIRMEAVLVWKHLWGVVYHEVDTTDKDDTDIEAEMKKWADG